MEWKKIKQNHEYSANENGVIRNSKTKRELTPTNRKGGAPVVTVGGKQYPASRLVFEAVREVHLKRGSRIIHLDGDTFNCAIENLFPLGCEDVTLTPERAERFAQALERASRAVRAIADNNVVFEGVSADVIAGFESITNELESAKTMIEKNKTK